MAVVDQQGLITARAVGEAVITVSYGGQTATCKVKVSGTTFTGRELPEKTGIPVNHVWTVKFNQAVNSSTINGDNIYVVNSSGTRQPTWPQIKADSNGKEVLVSLPTGNYQAQGVYWIYISQAVANASGSQTLAGNVRMKFATA